MHRVRMHDDGPLAGGNFLEQVQRCQLKRRLHRTRGMKCDVLELLQVQFIHLLYERHQFILTQRRQFYGAQVLSCQHLKRSAEITLCQRSRRKSHASHQKTPYSLVSGAMNLFSKKILSRACSNASLTVRMRLNVGSVRESLALSISSACRLASSSIISRNFW